ncbi:MAG TPA: hypothetical protein VKX28_19105 [Xanthobacteraceae bacterium]|nr:hypothetical protein [Xanthobacteraceae bacterium]
MLVVALLGAAVLAFAVCALWPRWPDQPAPADAPALPITIRGVLFNVPPRAMRVAVQRRAGAQERIDLVFAWPSLAPPDPAEPAQLGDGDRVFVTIAAATALAPLERLKTIYPRYVTSEAAPGPPGLSLLAFRDGTPYQGEDLAFDPAAPEKFLARCSRSANPLTPATCLAERRVGDADITVRFPRDWLKDWRGVEDGIEKLIAGLQPAGGS